MRAPSDAGTRAPVIGLGRILLVGSIPVVTMIAGSLLALVWLPGRRMRSLIQHFAAGVVFSVVSVELLPDFLHAHVLWIVAAGFSAGVALMLLVRLLAAEDDAEESAATADAHPASRALPRSAAGLVVPIGVDAVLDGVMIGIGFVAGAKQGVLLASALALEMFSIGLALTTTLRHAGSPLRRSAGVTIAIALLILVGVGAGTLLLAGASEHLLAGVFAFASAALLYLVTEELLVRAHAAAETTIATTMFFVGYLLFLLLGMME